MNEFVSETDVVASEQADSGGEFERQPVPKSRWLGFSSFIGMYAGEHCAGTELMIGPLFLAAGVSAFDLIVGLFIGNLLAVLSWTFLTAPIATRSRLTLYYQLERICGRHLVTLYNLANGIMFCFLAGSMVTVSATAFGVFFQFPMPTLDQVMPNSWEWCVAVGLVGLLISFVAAFGYEMVSRFANIASPWMVLVFLAFGLVALPQLGVHSVSDLMNKAGTEIWTGGDPLPGQAKFTFWHVMFFAWFCNMAMHIGMADLSVFRYARKSWYGVATASGMYVGHYMAWIAASLLYALQLQRDPSNTDVLPGPMANDACGLAGLICVVVAGWTTANPTIYRAGLAFQAILPNSNRFLITFLTGILATVAGMFPGIAMQLLGFVALYGLLLMPMGAIVFADFWLLPKLGLKSNLALHSGTKFNWAAALTWWITLIACVKLVKMPVLTAWLKDLSILSAETADWLNRVATVDLFFVSLPGWFFACLLYIVLNFVLPAQRRLKSAA